MDEYFSTLASDLGEMVKTALNEISVNEDFCRQGIGRALVETVKKWGRETGADEIWVLTNKENKPANALYRSTGGTAKNSDDIMYTFKL